MKCASGHLLTVCYVLYTIAIMPFGAGACASAQSASATVAFEVATIKPAAPFDPKKFGPRISLTRASYTDMSLKYLISYAYDLKMPQVSGPGWIASLNYDIVATIPEGASKESEKKMLQALLKERFGLTFHIQKSEGEVYSLVVGKQGAKLKPSPPDLPESDAPATNKDGSSTYSMGKKGTVIIKFDMESGTQHFERSKMSMKELAEYMPVCMGAGALEKYTFVDKTEIEGNYQVALDCPLDALGLKLEKRKALMDVYVVDHVEKPTEN